jgi:tetratricopeptide (TPR) repeat protein
VAGGADPRAVRRASGPALVAAVPVAALALLDGGYFATSWGWGALALAWAATLAAILRAPVRPGLLERIFVGGFAALAAWMIVSTIWSNASHTVLEAERALVYVAAALALVLVCERASAPHVLAGVLTAVAAVAAYALFTRLFPDVAGAYAPEAGYQLSEPFGYWNALGIAVAIAVLLALAFGARARSRAGRAAAAATLPIFGATLYFTFSRGAALALAIGLAAALVLEPRRLDLMTNALVLAALPAATIWLCSRSDPLARVGFPLEAAARDGHRLAPVILVLAAASAAVPLAVSAAVPRIRVARRLRVAYGAVLVAVAVVAVGAVLARAGGPVALLTRGYAAFNAPPPVVEGDLRRRLFSLSGNARAEFWRVAWSQYADNAWLGGGAGSYERYWARHRPTPFGVRDAHNLYLEVLAELGPLGLVLLLAALGPPVGGAIVARRHALVPPAFGAYSAFLVHAGVDWDWEMTAVTLAGVFTGGALLVAARPVRARPLGAPARWAALAGALALAGGAVVGLIGNGAIGASATASSQARWDEAEAEARRATRWAPWSADPWRWLAEAQLGRGDTASARASYRRAVAKDSENWELWFGLARASLGPERDRALERAARLNPLSPDIAELRAESSAG